LNHGIGENGVWEEASALSACSAVDCCHFNWDRAFARFEIVPPSPRLRRDKRFLGWFSRLGSYFALGEIVRFTTKKAHHAALDFRWKIGDFKK
jgi:hypothetical protein